MKKLIAIVSMLLILPLSAFGLTLMPDTQMNDITGQAGVSIAIDVDLKLDIDTVAWGDSDGVSGVDGTGGWVGLKDVNAGLSFAVRDDIAADTIELLTIDVATDGTYGVLGGDATYVRIGLGTFDLNGDIDMDFAIGSDKDLNATGQELGSLDIMDLQVLGAAGSYVDITTAGRASGVTLALNVLLDEINMGSLAWGDADGVNHIDGYVNGVSTAGYVGLANVDIDSVAVTGMLGIDVATLDPVAINDMVGAAGGPGNLTNPELVLAKLGGYMAANPGETSSTFVVLSLGNADGIADIAGGDINVGIGALNADVAIGDTSDLRNEDVMGSIYIGNANVTVDGIVGITAH